MSDDQRAQIVPCEIDGNRMYAAGQIWERGQQFPVTDGEPIYEWLPVRVDDEDPAA